MRKGLFLKYSKILICLGWMLAFGTGVSFCQNEPPVFSQLPNCYIAVTDTEDRQLAGSTGALGSEGGVWENGTFTSCYVAEKESLELHVYATDPNGNHISISVENAPSTALFSDLGNGEAKFLWMPEYLGAMSAAHSPYELFFVAKDESSSTKMRVLINVTNVNRNPELFVPDSLEATVGSPLIFQIRTKDLDSEKVDLRILNPPPSMNFDGATSIFNWVPQISDTGLCIIKFRATDQSGGVCLAETKISVLPPSVFNLSLGVKQALLGTEVEIPVNLKNSDPVAGMELCIRFDPLEFTFLGVSRTGCRTSDWEYFTYKEKTLGQFSLIKIVGIADFPNQHGALPLSPDSGTIVNLSFRLTTDPYLNGFLLPLEFYSGDFSDNTISTSRGKFIPRPEINATGGGVLLVASGTRLGDINQNGMAYEVGDAVTLVAYLSGKKTLNSQQLINSDVNQDGRMGTLSDLVFLITHIIEGLAPDGGNNPEGEPVMAKIKQEPLHTSISLDSDIPVGGAVVILKGEGLKAENLKLSPEVQGLDLYTSQVGDEFRVLVISPDSKPLPSGEKSLLVYDGEGLDSVSFSVSDQEGRLMKVDRQYENNTLPTKYTLYQNYPNPFNPETVIKYAVSGGGLTQVSLKIYNVVGQLVKTLVDEQQMPGEYSQTWNGKDEKNQDIASGMYFYKLKVADYTETKKMVLLR